MDVLFITPTTDMRLKARVNGTMLLASRLLEADISTRILRFGEIDGCAEDYPRFIENITREILAQSPRAVSFYTLWPDYHTVLRIARQVKEKSPDTVTVLGGIQATLTARQTMEAMPFVDYICTRNGEDTVVPFFRRVLAGQSPEDVPGVYYRQNGVVCHNPQEVPSCDLNALPQWDERLYMDSMIREELSAEDYYMPIDAGRGCPFGCTFCCSSLYWHRRYQLKSPERILEDMAHFNKKLGIRSFNFTHDALTVNKKLVSQICDIILEKKLDYRWRCTSRIDTVDPEYLLKMKEAGMRYIEFGVETGSPRMQQLINKRLDLQQVRETVRFCLDNGIKVGAFFIYGFPEETEEDVNQTLELFFQLVDMGISYCSLNLCSFNPETAITRAHMDELVLDHSMQIVHRGIFGYREELPVIEKNKTIFPFFYHLSTPVRDQYQYLSLLGFMYKKHTASWSALRMLYKGDNLAFYRDFYRGNQAHFQDIDQAIAWLPNNAMEVARNMLALRSEPFIPQLLGRMEYAEDLQQVFTSQEDQAVEREYAFSMIDYQKKLPLEDYSRARTRIRLEKKNSQNRMQVLHITYLD